MELVSNFSDWYASKPPWLPLAQWQPWYLHGAWALVLGAMVFGLSAQLSHAWHRNISLATVVWTLLPGAISPAHWLGLAFQSPSVMSLVLCILHVRHVQRAPAGYSIDTLASAWRWFAGWMALLGWILLLDALAWWPVSVYAWGFGTPLFAAVCLFLLLLWWRAKDSADFTVVISTLAGVELVFLLTRMPTGNLWDALIDPWLWIVLQVQLFRACFKARRGSAAIRA